MSDILKREWRENGIMKVLQMCFMEQSWRNAGKLAQLAIKKSHLGKHIFPTYNQSYLSL